MHLLAVEFAVAAAATLVVKRKKFSQTIKCHHFVIFLVKKKISSTVNKSYSLKKLLRLVCRSVYVHALFICYRRYYHGAGIVVTATRFTSLSG